MGGSGLDYYNPKQLVRLSTHPPPADQERLASVRAELAVAKKAWDKIRGTTEGLSIGPDGRPKQRPFRMAYERLQLELFSLTDAAANGDPVHGLKEAKVVADTEVRIRGEAERLGPLVPRGFLTAFPVVGAPQVNTRQSGRLELAQWLTSANNSLTARVAVNRIWYHLFGTGIVSTVDNFGINGDVPSHPELLDHLAKEFISGGWSTKRLIRTIVLSHAYRLGSYFPSSYREIDPANRLVWRHTPRRMEAEEIRDAMLASSGRLEWTPPPASPATTLPMVEIRDDGPEARGVHEEADRALYRSVYLPLLRGLTPRPLQAFDPVTQTLVTGQRDATTVPGQALFLLNSSFVRGQSLALARRLLAGKDRRTPSQIEQAYTLILGRAPSQEELTRSRKFLSEYEKMYGELPPPEPFAAARRAAEARSAELPVDQDDDRVSQVVVEESVRASSAREAAWMSLTQALYASAEFRFVR